jgi:hypothetical protein
MWSSLSEHDMLASSLGTDGQRSGNPVARLRSVDECEPVSPFACRQWLLILGEHVGYLFERKAEFSGLAPSTLLLVPSTPAATRSCISALAVGLRNGNEATFATAASYGE